LADEAAPSYVGGGVVPEAAVQQILDRSVVVAGEGALDGFAEKSARRRTAEDHPDVTQILGPPAVRAERREHLELATDEHLGRAEPEGHSDAQIGSNSVGPDRHGERRVDRDLPEVAAGASHREEAHARVRRCDLDPIDAEAIRLEDDSVAGV